MYLDRGQRTEDRRQQQSGYLMPLAAFILVVMGLMAVALSRNTTQTGIATTQEAITLQAFYAAESGAQLGMNRLFYNTGATLTQAIVDSACDSLNISQNLSAAANFGNCSHSVTCSRSATGITHFYTVTSVGQCGSGEITSTRTVEVSAFME